MWSHKTHKADHKKMGSGFGDGDDIISSNILLHLFIPIRLQVTHQQLSTDPS